jgi:hypothetical protein
MASAKGEQDRTITALRQVSTRALFDIHYNFLGSRRLIFLFSHFFLNFTRRCGQKKAHTRKLNQAAPEIYHK